MVDSFVEVLGVDRVSTTDSFFDLGGSSLVATRIVSALHSRFRRRIPLQWMFLDPTPAGIARRLDMPTADAGMEELLAVVVPLRTKGTGRPLFCVHPGIGLSWGGMPAWCGICPRTDPCTDFSSPRSQRRR